MLITKQVEKLKDTIVEKVQDTEVEKVQGTKVEELQDSSHQITSSVTSTNPFPFPKPAFHCNGQTH